VAPCNNLLVSSLSSSKGFGHVFLLHRSARRQVRYYSPRPVLVFYATIDGSDSWQLAYLTMKSAARFSKERSGSSIVSAEKANDSISLVSNFDSSV
jgi:hypothetical protein